MSRAPVGAPVPAPVPPPTSSYAPRPTGPIFSVIPSTDASGSVTYQTSQLTVTPTLTKMVAAQGTDAIVYPFGSESAGNGTISVTSSNVVANETQTLTNYMASGSGDLMAAAGATNGSLFSPVSPSQSQVAFPGGSDKLAASGLGLVVIAVVFLILL